MTQILDSALHSEALDHFQLLSAFYGVDELSDLRQTLGAIFLDSTANIDGYDAGAGALSLFYRACDILRSKSTSQDDPKSIVSV